MTKRSATPPGRKLTPWYPASIQPARVGVYERDMETVGRWSYWDGKQWCGWGGTIGIAEANGMQGHVSSVQNERWRGLAKEPK